MVELISSSDLNKKYGEIPDSLIESVNQLLCAEAEKGEGGCNIDRKELNLTKTQFEQLGRSLTEAGYDLIHIKIADADQFEIRWV